MIRELTYNVMCVLKKKKSRLKAQCVLNVGEFDTTVIYYNESSL